MSNPFKNKMPLAQIFTRASAMHIPVYKERVKRGIDAGGQAFPRYSGKYAEHKARWFTRKDGKTRLKSYKQLPITSNETKTPDFTVTGLTLKNAKPTKVNRHGWYLTYTGKAGDIVEGNAKRKRDIISGVPPKESQFIADYIDREIVKIYGGNWQEKININISVK
jgi:hypothetical protein